MHTSHPFQKDNERIAVFSGPMSENPLHHHANCTYSAPSSPPGW